MNREKPATNEIYHIYNRGVDKRQIFMDDEDRIRFIHDLFEFNDQNPVQNLNYYFAKHLNGKTQYMEVELPYIGKQLKNNRRPREFLVDLLVFCLMPNHFHLMVRQRVDGGVSEFMRKMGTGYTNYFNEKYERSGSLFQGRYKFKIIKQDSHFIHIPYYIHCNPLDLYMPNWRDKQISDYQKALKYLESYKWSSYQDYIGKKNFPSITQRELLLDFFNGSQQHKKDMTRWLKEMNLEDIKHLTLE